MKRFYIFIIISVFAYFAKAQSFSVGDNVQVIDNGVNLRSGPASPTVVGVANFGDKGTIKAGPASAVLSGTYYWWYQVQWTSGANSGTYSWIVQNYLQKTSATAIAPTKPTNMSPGETVGPGPFTNPISGSSVMLSWSASSGTAPITYEVAVTDLTTNTLVVDQKTSSTSYIANLQLGRLYRWNIQATNSAGSSGWTTRLYFQTPPDNTPPAIPTGLTATAVSSSQINLSWNAVLGANGYDVHKCDGTYIRYTPETSLSVTGLSPNTFYQFKVKAQKNSSCVSDYTSCVGATTQSADTPTPTISSVSPPSLTASNSDQQIIVYGSNFQSSSYLVFTDTKGNNYASNTSKITYVNSSQINYMLNNANDVGTWKVRVYNSSSAYSNSYSFEVVASTTCPECSGECFGTLLGSFNGVNTYSNCRPDYNSNQRDGGTGLKYQCCELVNRYYKTIYGIDLIAKKVFGDANTYYSRATTAGLTSYPNGGAIAPQVGDIICSNSGEYGHVAIVKSVSANNIEVFQQNFSNKIGGCYATLTRSGNTIGGFSSNYPVVGWVRYKSTAASPNLVPQNITLSTHETTVGSTITVNWRMANTGTGSSTPTQTGVRITSSSSNYSGTTLTNVAVPAIGAGGSVQQSATITVPSTPGTYYVWIIADNVSSGAMSQSNYNDDFQCSSALTVKEKAQQLPNLVPQNITLSTYETTAGSTITVNWRMANTGTGSSTPTQTGVRITSSFSNYSGTTITNVAVPAIGAGSYVQQSATVTVPSTAGTYYVWIIADNVSSGAMSQSNYNDDFQHSNAFTVTGTVTDGKVYGVDIYSGNGDVNWSAVYEAEKLFAYVKATKGTGQNPQITIDCPPSCSGYVDGKFFTNMTSQNSNNVILGAYHYALPEDNPDATIEADYFYEIAGSYIGKGFLPPALDMEGPEGCCVNNKEKIEIYYQYRELELARWVNTWCTRIHKLSGVWPVLYTTRCIAAMLYPYYKNTINQNIKLWIADTSNEPGNPGNSVGCNWVGWPWLFHQFYHPDVAGNNPSTYANPGMDQNIFNGDIDDLYALVGLVSDVSKLKNQNDFHVYPNPATATVSVKVPNADDNLILEIISLQGSIIYKNNYSVQKNDEISIDISGYECGVYLIKLMGKNNIAITKIIKE